MSWIKTQKSVKTMALTITRQLDPALGVQFRHYEMMHGNTIGDMREDHSDKTRTVVSMYTGLQT